MKTPRVETLDQGGFEPFPNLYADRGLMRDISDMPDAVLEAKAVYYSTFLQGDLMPRARAQAEYIARHLSFERIYREGL